MLKTVKTSPAPADVLTCEHELGGVGHGEHHQPDGVGGQADQRHPVVLQAALHEPQPQQAAQVGQVLRRRPVADERRAPAQRRAQLEQHQQLPGAGVHRHHREEAQRVQPQPAPGARPLHRLAAATPRREEAPGGLVVAEGEELGGRVGPDRLGDEQVRVQSRRQVGGQGQPEGIDVPARGGGTWRRQRGRNTGKNGR